MKDSLHWLASLIIVLCLAATAPLPAQESRSGGGTGQAEAVPQAEQTGEATKGAGDAESSEESREEDASFDFAFQYAEGDQYRILSRVDQTVRMNGRFSHTAEMLNRIAVEVTEVKEDSGHFSIDYQNTGKSESGAQVYEFEREYEAEFWRDARGRYDVPKQYYVPVVRDVPVFPEDPVEVGETWSYQGKEVHDLRQGFGIEEAFRFPMPVNYEYLGMRSHDGQEYPAISIQYNIFHRPDKSYDAPVYPTMISGYSDQILYWNAEYGRPQAYEEEYLIVFDLSDGRQIQFEGTADAEVVQADQMDREKMSEDIERDLKELEVEDATVAPDERGVTITLDNIQFPPDSARLRDNEKDKLRRVAEILRKYPDRDVLITGHTAMAGTAEGRQQLSEQRAAAVGEYLLEIGVRDPGRLLYQGKGAREPVADNSTPEGMRKNRRVEFTLLEN